MEYAVYQYDEMEAIAKGIRCVAVAVPSGTMFKAPYDFATNFYQQIRRALRQRPRRRPLARDHR